MILVTGATSPTGGRLVRKLVEKHERVRCFIKTLDHAHHLPGNEVEIFQGDLDQANDIQRALSNVRIIVNVAHIRFAPALVAAARNAAIQRMIFLSSTRKYTRFPDPTARVVDESEAAIRSSGLAWTILRLTMIFGDERDRNISKLIRYIQAHRIIPIPGSGRNLVQPIFVWDVVEALLRIMDSPAAVGKEYTLAGPQPLRYSAMVRTIAHALGRRAILVPVPVRVVLRVARLLERLGYSLPLSAEQIQRMAEDRAFDISAVCKELGFTPRSFEQGLALKLQGKV
jgi:uncharacterized protein YbjT (DUF2867 family)